MKKTKHKKYFLDQLRYIIEKLIINKNQSLLNFRERKMVKIDVSSSLYIVQGRYNHYSITGTIDYE